MRKIEMNGYKRITKGQARRLYNNGFSVLFCPVNMRPNDKYYNLSIEENVNMFGQFSTFETLCNAFECHNCNNETGKYTAFYIPVDSGFLHLTFKSGSNPFVKYGDLLELEKELEKWRKAYPVTMPEKGKNNSYWSVCNDEERKVAFV